MVFSEVLQALDRGANTVMITDLMNENALPNGLYLCTLITEFGNIATARLLIVK